MSMTVGYKIFGVKIDPDDLAGAVTLGGITDDRIGSGTQIYDEVSSGNPYSLFIALLSGNPTVNFSSYNLAAALNACSFTGLRISAASLTGVTLYAYKVTEGGLRVAGANHTSFNIKEGLLFPTKISLPHQGNAKIDYALLITYDGTNQPVVMAGTISVPTAPSDPNRYSIGRVQLGLVDGDKIELTEMTDVEINFNVKAAAIASDSDIFPTLAYIESIHPTLKITTYLVDKLKSSGGVALTGKQLAAAKTIFFARQRAVAGSTTTGYVADNATTHISFIPTLGCAYHDDILVGSIEGLRTATIMANLFSDGTTPPLVIDTTADQTLL